MSTIRIDTPGTERRVALRRQPAVGTVCRLDVAGDKTPHLALVWNVSSSGLSMLVHEPVQPGTELRGELSTTRDALSVTLRVVHLCKLRTGDYMLGAQFRVPLTAKDMGSFVDSPS